MKTELRIPSNQNKRINKGGRYKSISFIYFKTANSAIKSNQNVLSQLFLENVHNFFINFLKIFRAFVSICGIIYIYKSFAKAILSINVLHLCCIANKCPTSGHRINYIIRRI